MERFWKAVVLICIIYLAAVMVITPAGCISSARAAVNLCLDVVIPSLFPFFVCSSLLVSLGAAALLSRYLSHFMKPLFGISGSGALALILGIISGYPTGAACAAKLYSNGNCTKAEAHRLLAFCNNSGPLFVLSAVGIGIFNSRKIGVILYASHILSAFITGMLFKKYGHEFSSVPALPPAPPHGIKSVFTAFETAVSDSVTAILKVCGFVILFAVFSSALPAYKGSEIVYALLEITGGIKALSGFKELGSFLLPAVSFFLALSGISVLMQTAGIISPLGLSLKPYIAGKLVQGIFSFLITCILLVLFPVSQSAFISGVPVPSCPVPTVRELFGTAVLCASFGAISVLTVILIGRIAEKIKKAYPVKTK